MSTFTKSIIALVCAAVITAAIWGAYQYPAVVQLAGSAVGTTFNTAKIASINMSPLTSAASSTSILNTDDSARWIKTIDVACTGVGTSNAFTGGGLQAFLMQVATSSTAIQASGNGNFAGNLLIATSSAFAYTATSSASSGSAVSAAVNYYWPAGAYESITFNATNTAACTVSMSYMAT